jgi:hypothetical protein
LGFQIPWHVRSSKESTFSIITGEPEKVKAEILKGFEAAGELKSADGKTFAEKIKAGELPATDAGL